MGEINQDPSMEDILASIKRVIAEDGRAAPARTLRGARAADGDRVVPLAGGEEDVLELQDPVGEGDGLVSDDAASASRQALAALVSVRGAADIGTPQGDGALEAVVREMLKPMLKDWLDQNLPGIVEELVTREIARITGKSL
jgi:cell pole-organizing protein PopZ